MFRPFVEQRRQVRQHPIDGRLVIAGLQLGCPVVPHSVGADEVERRLAGADQSDARPATRMADPQPLALATAVERRRLDRFELDAGVEDNDDDPSAGKELDLLETRQGGAVRRFANPSGHQQLDGPEAIANWLAKEVRTWRMAERRLTMLVDNDSVSPLEMRIVVSMERAPVASFVVDQLVEVRGTLERIASYRAPELGDSHE